MGFVHRTVREAATVDQRLVRIGHALIGPRPKPLPAVDEVGVKRAERELVDAGSQMQQLIGRLTAIEQSYEGAAAELAGRMRRHVFEAESDLPRLMFEARGQLRGED